MIAAALLIGVCASLLGLVAWVVILPPRERDGFEDFDLNENHLAAEGAAKASGTGSGAGLRAGQPASDPGHE